MLDELHRERPEDADVLTLRGIVYRERGLFADAEADLKAALKVDARLGGRRTRRSASSTTSRCGPRQRPSTARRSRPRPTTPPSSTTSASRCILRQHYKEAITTYESAARLAPLSPRVRTNLGFAYAALGDLRRAAREFQMGGTEAEAKNNLGFAYERRGDMANAYELYVEALRLDPKADARALEPGSRRARARPTGSARGDAARHGAAA